MEIRHIKDIKIVAGEMHDSEFAENDFSFNVLEKTFYLRSHSQNFSREFHLNFFNVEYYDPINLEKVKAGRAVAGILNDIKIRKNGLVLELLSQDLKILLKLNKLEGIFEILEKKE